MSNWEKQPILLPTSLDIEQQIFGNGYIFWFNGKTRIEKHAYFMSDFLMPIALINKLQLKISPWKNLFLFYNSLSLKQSAQLLKKHNLMSNTLQHILINLVCGFKIYMRARGVGYKFVIKNNKLILYIGYSHLLVTNLPHKLTYKLSRKSKMIQFKYYSWSILTNFFAKLRRLRKPNVYTGKGLRYRRKDPVIRKEGKKKKL